MRNSRSSRSEVLTRESVWDPPTPRLGKIFFVQQRIHPPPRSSCPFSLWKRLKLPPLQSGFFLCLVRGLSKHGWAHILCPHVSTYVTDIWSWPQPVSTQRPSTPSQSSTIRRDGHQRTPNDKQPPTVKEPRGLRRRSEPAATQANNTPVHPPPDSALWSWLGPRSGCMCTRIGARCC